MKFFFLFFINNMMQIIVTNQDEIKIIKMQAPLGQKSQKQQIFIDNSINDDSFLRELLMDGNYVNQFPIPGRLNQSEQSFQKFTNFQLEQSKVHQKQKNITFVEVQEPHLCYLQKIIQQDSDQKLQAVQNPHDNPDKTQKTLNFSRIKPIDQKQIQQHVLDLSNKVVDRTNDRLQQKSSFGSSLMQTSSEDKKSKIDESRAKKLQDKKKQRQRALQEKKQKLQILKMASQRFQQVKKQKDKKIKDFAKDLLNLKTSKQKNLIKSEHKLKLLQIQENRKNEKKYYEAMMIQKMIMDKILAQKVNEMKQKQLQEPKNTLKTQKKKKVVEILTKNQQQERKINEIRDLLQRRNSYQDKLTNMKIELMRQKPKPVKQKSEMQLKSEQRRMNTKSLSAMQIYRMGQEYMEKAHSIIGPEIIQKSKLETEREFVQSTRIQYKDYLKDSKLKRSRLFQSTGKLKNNKEVRQLKNLIRKEENSPDKLLMAKLISGKLDEKVGKSSSTRLKADSIAVKLKIIQEFL